jgi:hypothetical protein
MKRFEFNSRAGWHDMWRWMTARAHRSTAVVAMLNRGPIASTGEQAIERFKFIQSLKERFDTEMKDKNKSDEEPGIGNRG